MSSRRLFFALQPPMQLRQQLAALLPAGAGSGLKLSSADNLHVTLVFLGQVADSLLPQLQRRAAALHIPVFELQFQQLQFWPRPKVLCLCCAQPPTALQQLAAALTEIAVAAGIELEQRPYRPHITLARKAKSEMAIELPPIRWQAVDFALYESVSGPSGPIYRVLQRWPLQSTDPSPDQ